MMIDFVVKMGKNYKPQVFVEEFKCIVKENKRIKFIIDALELGFLINFFWFSFFLHKFFSCSGSSIKKFFFREHNKLDKLEVTCFIHKNE